MKVSSSRRPIDPLHSSRTNSRWTHVGRIVLGLALLLATAAAQGQDSNRYRPKDLPERRPEAKLPDTAKEPTGSNTLLVGQLKGLILVDHPSKVERVPPAVEGIRIDSPSLAFLNNETLQQRLRTYLDDPVTIRSLHEIAREIVIFYRHSDRPVVDVGIPEQDISNGVVQIVVTEARVGRVLVEGPQYFSPRVLVRETYTCPGQEIRESVVIGDLNWLNRNPFRTTDVEFRPGQEAGQTDVVFKVKDRPPVRAYMGYEDTGTSETDLERVFVGANWGNALWLDHQFGYQYTSSPDFQKLQSHSGVYAIPLLNRDTIVTTGSYATVTSTTAQQLDMQGYGWQTTVHYNHTLDAWGCYEHSLHGGFDFKQTNTNLDFGGTQVFTSPADVAEMVVGYEGLRRDDYGTWALGTDLYVSPGGFTSLNNTAAYQQIRAGALASFIYGRSYLERVTSLPYNLQLMGRVTGQVADGNLLPTEQLGFGGYDSIRGYDMRRVNGDSGYIVNLELRTEPICLGLDRCRRDQCQFLVFYDMGGAMNHTIAAGEDPVVGLSSVGLGARYTVAPAVALRFDYGWQLQSVAPDPLGSRAHISAVVSY